MMGWKKNKFSSELGQEYIGKIFDLIFAEPMFESNKIETEDLDRQVNHFKNNALSIVNLMKKFVVGYGEVPMSEAVSTGIQICPHCRRRDFIWNWEIVDVGHYASPEDWVSSVEPKEWNGGLSHEKDRYLFMARYKCNHVTTCNKCKTTSIGHFSSCQECGSTDVVKAGCQKESYGKHFIKEYTAENNHPTNRNYLQNVLLKNREIKNPNDRKERKQGELIGYKYERKMPSKGMAITDYSEVKKYMPYVIFTYGATFDDGTFETKDVLYPLSELNFALSKKRRQICRNGLNNCHQGRPYELSENENVCRSSHFFVGSNGFLDAFNGECGARMPPTIVQEAYYYNPSLMNIMAEQPLGSAAMSGRTKNGEPVYFIHLMGSVDEEYKILLPLPMIESLSAIPDSPEPITASSSPPSCPNDVGAAVMVEDLVKKAKESMEDMKEQLSEQLKAYFDLGPADANTSEGYSFVICEGRSRHAILENGNWIDKSPKCNADGKSYARWNHVPSYADPDSTFDDYLGPNPNSHFVQDWLKASDQIISFVSNPPVYHYVDGIGEIVRETEGVIIDIMECETCKGIVEAKGIIPYRHNLNQCDENGVAINGFSQEVLDAEIEYQASYPMENQKGEVVPTAWGIIASAKHDGKDMLKRITKYKFD